MRTFAVARLSRTGLSLSISALLASGAAMAQSTTTDAAGGTSSSSAAAIAPKQLDQVVVRGEYIPEPMLQTSEVASFVTREDRSAPATAVPQSR